MLLVLVVALVVSACGGSSNDDDTTKTGTAPTASTSDAQTTADEGGAADGKSIFGNQCSVCHGATGGGGNGGPPINQGKNKEGVITQVTNGGGGMPAFSGQLSEEEIAAVADHVVSFQK